MKFEELLQNLQVKSKRFFLFYKLSAVFLFCVSIHTGFAQDISVCAERSDFLYDAFYRDNLIFEDEVLKALESLKKDFPEQIETQEQENHCILYLRYGTVLSAYYSANKNPQTASVLEEIEKIGNKIVTDFPFFPALSLCYADYLCSSIFWKDGIFLIKNHMPIMYRRILLCCTENDDMTEQTLTKLALWFARFTAEDTPSKNTFIEKHKSGIENLSDVDKFMGYLTLSMFYMRKYDTAEGWACLSQARKIYPNNALLTLVSNNYSKGKLDW